MTFATLWLGGILLLTVPYIWGFALCRVARGEHRPLPSTLPEDP